MLVDRPEYYDLYRAVQADAAAAPVTVLVSAADCDACATFRTLRSLFKADFVPFSAFPVAGYEDLQRRGAELPRDDAVRGGRSSQTRRADPAAFKIAPCARLAPPTPQRPARRRRRQEPPPRYAGSARAGRENARCGAVGAWRAMALRRRQLRPDSPARARSRDAWCSSTAAARRICGACLVRAAGRHAAPRAAHGARRMRFSRHPFAAPSAARAPDLAPRRTPPRLCGSLQRAPPRACPDQCRAPSAAPLPPSPLRKAAALTPCARAAAAQSLTRGRARGAW